MEKKPKKNQKNCKKIGRNDVWVPSYSTVCSESCSAQLGAVLRWNTHPLLGFLHKSIYRQHIPNPDWFFASCKTALVFPGQTAGQLSRSASGSPASVRRQQRWETGTGAATLLWALFQKLMRSQKCPWER